jgi:hypothetical protein
MEELTGVPFVSIHVSSRSGTVVLYGEVVTIVQGHG